mgnify:CR=1 FL=1
MDHYIVYKGDFKNPSIIKVGFNSKEMAENYIKEHPGMKYTVMSNVEYIEWMSPIYNTK